MNYNSHNNKVYSDINTCSNVYILTCKNQSFDSVSDIINSLNTVDLKTLAKTHCISVETLKRVQKLNAMIGGSKMMDIAKRFTKSASVVVNPMTNSCGCAGDDRTGKPMVTINAEPKEITGGKLPSLPSMANVKDAVDVMKEAVAAAKEFTGVIKSIKGTDYVTTIEQLNQRITDKNAQIQGLEKQVSDLKKQIEHDLVLNKKHGEIIKNLTNEKAKLEEQNRRFLKIVSKSDL